MRVSGQWTSGAPHHPVIPAISSRFAISQFYFLSSINTGAKLISGDDFYPIVSRFIQWQPLGVLSTVSTLETLFAPDTARFGNIPQSVASISIFSVQKIVAMKLNNLFVLCTDPPRSRAVVMGSNLQLKIEHFWVRAGENFWGAMMMSCIQYSHRVQCAVHHGDVDIVDIGRVSQRILLTSQSIHV